MNQYIASWAGQFGMNKHESFQITWLFRGLTAILALSIYIFVTTEVTLNIYHKVIEGNEMLQGVSAASEAHSALFDIQENSVPMQLRPQLKLLIHVTWKK